MSLIQKTYKSTDTEEWFDIIFNRPLGYLWARLFNHYGVHPNTVTVLSIILGVTGGLLFMNDADTTSGFLLNLLGVILFVWADIFDSTDGQLARMTGKKTQFGRILDGASGDFWFFCVYLSIALRLQDKPIDFSLFTVHFSLPHWGLLAWVLVFFSGVFCHAAQCRQSDYYRTIHLHFLNGTPLDRADDQARISSSCRGGKPPSRSSSNGPTLAIRRPKNAARHTSRHSGNKSKPNTAAHRHRPSYRSFGAAAFR